MRLDWRPKAPRLFFGWWLVAACFFIALYTGGVIFYGFTAVFEPVADEFHWSYAQISFAASLRGIESGLLVPVTGILVDRWGPRRLVLSGALVVAGGLLLLSRTDSLGMFYGAFALLAVGMSLASPTVLMTSVVNWFRKRVGTATGILACGYGFGGLLIPLIIDMIDRYDWRTAMLILALGMLAVGLPLSFVVRHKPEAYGYLPDGEEYRSPLSGGQSAAPTTAELHVPARDALRSRTFWHIALALVCQTLCLGAVVTHVMPYLSSVGIARATAGLVASGIPLVSIAGRLGLGWLGDRVDKRKVAALAFAILGAGLLCFGFTSRAQAWLLVPFLVLFGIGYGGNAALCPALVREFFGRGSFGAIHGLVMGVMMVGAVLGPLLAGKAFDDCGSYQTIWLVFSGFAAAAVFLVASTPSVGVVRE